VSRILLRLVDVASLRGDEKLQSAFVARYGRMPEPGEHGAIIKDETRCIRCGLAPPVVRLVP